MAKYRKGSMAAADAKSFFRFKVIASVVLALVFAMNFLGLFHTFIDIHYGPHRSAPLLILSVASYAVAAFGLWRGDKFSSFVFPVLMYFGGIAAGIGFSGGFS